MFHRTRIKCKNVLLLSAVTHLSYSINTKFVGVIIDEKCYWSDHIRYIKNKISKAIGLIN